MLGDCQVSVLHPQLGPTALTPNPAPDVHTPGHPFMKPHQFQNLHNNLVPHNPSHVDSRHNSVLTQFSESQSWRQSQSQQGAAATLPLPSLLHLAPPLAYSVPCLIHSHSPTFTISFSKFLVYVLPSLSFLLSQQSFLHSHSWAAHSILCVSQFPHLHNENMNSL